MTREDIRSLPPFVGKQVGQEIFTFRRSVPETWDLQMSMDAGPCGWKPVGLNIRKDEVDILVWAE